MDRILAESESYNRRHSNDNLPGDEKWTLRILPSIAMSELVRPEREVDKMGVIAMNQLINNGEGLYMDRGNGGVVNILPKNIKPALHIEKVDHWHNHYGFSEKIRVLFKNGHTACLEIGYVEEIDEEDLKEFHANCIMIHDI